MSFGETVQSLREKAGLSQSELARKAGVPVRSVQNWEQGHRLPRPQALLPLAEALEVPVEHLIKSMSTTTKEPPARTKGRAAGQGGKKRKGKGA
jgi:transcriptional regulator with XRE-family HTH domain